MPRRVENAGLRAARAAAAEATEYLRLVERDSELTLEEWAAKHDVQRAHAGLPPVHEDGRS